MRLMRFRRTLDVLVGIFFSTLAVISLLFHILWGNDNFVPRLETIYNRILDFYLTPEITFNYLAPTILTGLGVLIAIFWWLKIITRRGTLLAYLQPLTFLITGYTVATVVIYNKNYTNYYANPATRINILYIIILIAILIMTGLHIFVFGALVPGIKKPKGSNKQVDELFAPQPKAAVPAPAPAPAPVKEEPVEETEEVVLVEFDEESLEALEKRCRDVIRSEMADYVILKKDNVYLSSKDTIIKEVVKEVPAEKKEEPAPAPAPAKKEPAPAPAPIVKAEPEPLPEPKPILKKVSQPVVRIPFNERVLGFSKELKDKYNELKNYILSYDVKSRISNSGDSFRSKRKLYVKITSSGNSGFRVYFALNPEDYKDSPIPVKASGPVKAYEETPAFLRVSSDLSVKRAKELVDDVMRADKIERINEVGNVNYIKDLKAK